MAEEKMTEREWRNQRRRGAKLEVRTCYCKGAVQVEIYPNGDISVYHFRKAAPPERLIDGFYPVTACPFKGEALNHSWYDQAEVFPPVGGPNVKD